jgi:hypothetical protein
MSIKKSLLIIFYIFSANSIALASDANVNCPTVQTGLSIFNASKISKNSVVSVERREGNYPVALVMYSQVGGGLCRKSEFAKYPIEGAIPTVSSLFFYKVDGKINIFTIVSWSINHRGLGTYGTLYQVYAYTKSDDGSLKENMKITDDYKMTGIDGYDDGQESTFRYKTANDVKRAVSHFHDRN